MDHARRRRLPTPSRALLVWAYVLVLAGLAAATWLGIVHHTEPLSAPHLPWWAVAIGFAGAEVCVVHVRFRHSSHSFSLADLPFVFGLVFATGDAFMAGALLGTALIWGVVRRLQPVKLAFNLAQLALAIGVAAGILRAVVHGDGALEPGTWVGLYAATLASGALTISLLGGAITIAEGSLRARMLVQMFATDLLVTLVNASIGIAAALVVATDARAVPVLLVPALTVFVIYRAYISERERHERLEFLYDANRSLSRSPEVAEAIEALLARSLEAFNADVAEVLLFADSGPLRTTHGPGTHRATMEPVDRLIAEELATLVDSDTPVVSLTPPFGSPRLRAHMQERGIRHAMVAMLPGEERTIGTILLANRVGLERSFGRDDLRLLEALANNAAVALQYDRLEQAIAKLRSLQDQLHHQAYHDPLTDLPNRTLFMERVRDELARGNGQVAVLFVDVDDFKTVNDSLGHAVGDALLASVAERLRGCVRPQDTVARLGGDEFAVMLPGVEDPLVDGRAVATRILRAFELPVEAGPELVSVHLSVGVADSRQSGDDSDELIRNADVAMYQAKSKGKSRFELFEPSMAAAIVHRHDTKEELAKAIEREQMVVEYQPIVALDTGRIVAAEALVRWEHPVRGLVPPADFVPLAEETGLIVPLGRHVLREACRQARLWQDDEPLRMHVNLSVAELRDPGLVEHVMAAIRDAGIDPGQLVIEITESQLLAGASVERFAELRALGVRIALDDFGTGYSSLSCLHSLPLDTLKIAKPFIDGLTAGGRESSFVSMIVDLARTLDLEVIAEGIEHADQLAALRELGAGLGQGFYLGRPAPPAPQLRRPAARGSGD